MKSLSEPVVSPYVDLAFASKELRYAGDLGSA